MKQESWNAQVLSTNLLMGAGLVACLVWLAICFLPTPIIVASEDRGDVGDVMFSASSMRVLTNLGQENTPSMRASR